MYEQSQKLNEEAQEIDKLPYLKCQIVAETKTTSILKKDSTSLSVLRIGKIRWGNDDSDWGVRGRSGSSKTERKVSQGIDWDYNSVLNFPSNTKLSIEGKLYEIDFETVILSSKIGRFLNKNWEFLIQQLRLVRLH